MTPGSFAAALARRHAAGTGRWRRAPLVLLQPRLRPVGRPASVRHFHRHVTARIAVHLRQSLLDARASITVHQQLQRVVALSPHVTAREPAGRSVSPPHHVVHTAHLVPAPVARPVPMVIRHAAHELEHGPSGSAARPAATSRSEPRATERRPSLALPSVELDRVTDHVLKSLDRRLSSWRDRRGVS